MLSTTLRQCRASLLSLRNQYPILRHITATTIFLLILWFYTINQGERAVFAAKISGCDWDNWEQALPGQPHRIVFIADPQLIDAHTYPGRPWPLSMLTEQFTDRYMARSFRMINALLDPDSIIFLGDMLDGGREWSPASARPLSKRQKGRMETLSPATRNVQAGFADIGIDDAGWNRRQQGQHAARDVVNELEVGNKTAEIRKERRETDEPNPFNFVHGENGRWKTYDNNYWEWEYDRFGKIFFAPDQLYPDSKRRMEALSSTLQDSVNVENGAIDKTRTIYGIVDGKSRNILASLPGNHDLGFGSGVQLPVRGRYKWHFGEMNRVDVLANHTFVSIDALSLAAWSQFEDDGGESEDSQVVMRKHLFAPTQHFLDDLPHLITKETERILKEWYPESFPSDPRHQQLVSRAVDDTPESHEKSEMPVILLTHVPLYRAAGTSCGEQRERGTSLSITGGYQYQNVLTQTLSSAIAQKIDKIARLWYVMSGDDHDYCKVQHEFHGQGTSTYGVVEETVKSFSWAMGVRHPGFMMMSLWNPVDERGYSTYSDGPQLRTHLCLLPDQLGIFIRYGWLAVATVILLLMRTTVLALGNNLEQFNTAGDIDILASLGKLKGLAVGKTTSRHRQRASSSALKPPSNDHLSVQRTPTARARSVSPGFGFESQSSPQQMLPRSGASTPLGYSDDEESRVGDMDYLDEDDTQAKWRRRRRPHGKVWQAWEEFSGGLMLVAVGAITYYIVLIRRG